MAEGALILDKVIFPKKLLPWK